MDKSILISTLVNLPSMIHVRTEETVCPGCGTTYVRREYRRHAKDCVICKGKEINATEADNAVVEMAQHIDDISTEDLTKIVSRLGCSFWRAELRGALKLRLEGKND